MIKFFGLILSAENKLEREVCMLYFTKISSRIILENFKIFYPMYKLVYEINGYIGMLLNGRDITNKIQ